MIRFVSFGVVSFLMVSLSGCGNDHDHHHRGSARPGLTRAMFVDGNYYRRGSQAPLIVVKSIYGRQRILLLDRCGTRLVSGSFRARPVIDITHGNVACQYRLQQTMQGLSVTKSVPGQRFERTLLLTGVDRAALRRELIRRYHSHATRGDAPSIAQTRVIEEFFRREFDGEQIPAYPAYMTR